jgi:transcriptional regulator with XRE-family HTH domain
MQTEYTERYRIMGLKIAYYRKRAGYTQEAFAEKIDRSLNFLAQVEGAGTTRGISLETLFKICDVLGIQPGDLLDQDKT